ncbi:MAG: GNAT family N-acetyltransferase, partial [Planctomycetaceae bacterium]
EIETAVAARHGREHFQGVTVQPMVDLNGYELILGSKTDEQFGPIVLFGSGGQLVEVYRDRAVALPPLNSTLAERLIEKTRISKALHGVRGRPPVDFANLKRTLIRFASLLLEQPRIKECDINPLIVSPAGVIALDARFILYPADQSLKQIPPAAVRPYPTEYISYMELLDGTPIAIRPIRLEDESLMVAFHESLSFETVHQRYWHAMALSERTSHERLVRVCDTDFDREVAIVADRLNPETSQHQILGVGRLSRDPGADVAEFAVIVSDAWQGKGIGTVLLRQLIEIGRRERIRRIFGNILSENVRMLDVCRELGFQLHFDAAEREMRADLSLAGE